MSKMSVASKLGKPAGFSNAKTVKQINNKTWLVFQVTVSLFQTLRYSIYLSCKNNSVHFVSLFFLYCPTLESLLPYSGNQIAGDKIPSPLLPSVWTWSSFVTSLPLFPLCKTRKTIEVLSRGFKRVQWVNIWEVLKQPLTQSKGFC